MDKILRQEEKKNLEEEKAIEETDEQVDGDGEDKVIETVPEQTGETPPSFSEEPREKGETDEQVDGDGEDNAIETVPEQTGETPSSFSEEPRENEETLIEKCNDTSAGDTVMLRKENKNSDMVALTKYEEASDINRELVYTEKEQKSVEGEKPTEKIEEILVSDVIKSSVEKDNKSIVMLPDLEGENIISPVEVLKDFEKKDESKEENETVRCLDKEEKSDEKDVPLPNDDDISTLERIEQANNKAALHEKQSETATSLIEQVGELGNRKQSRDLVDETFVNTHEIFEPENIIEENKTVVTPTEIELNSAVVVAEEIQQDVKNVEDNYVLVEREVDEFEESKEILKEENVADGVSDATISNLEEKQTASSVEIQEAKRDLVGPVEVTESGMKNSSASCKEIDHRLLDISTVPKAEVVTKENNFQDPLGKQRDLESSEIVKEQVGKETDYTGEEQVKEVAGTVVEIIQNKNQENVTETEATKVEKEREEIKDEEHDEEEEEEEDERHQERETEIIGRDLPAKAEARETEMKLTQKKSHNILSGTGSKVKHSLAKVKKAITGKSKNVSPSAK